MWMLRLASLLPLVMMIACGEGSTLAEVSEPSNRILQAMECGLQTGTSRIGCKVIVPRLQSADFLIIGGPNGDSVYLSSDSTTFKGDTLSTRVRITNLLPVVLGTTDGYTVNPDGIRVFFSGAFEVFPADSSLPYSVTLMNPDGFHVFFPGLSDPYFQYPGLLYANHQSIGRWWRFRLENVDRFKFWVFVWAHVHNPATEHEQGGGG